MSSRLFSRRGILCYSIDEVTVRWYVKLTILGSGVQVLGGYCELRFYEILTKQFGILATDNWMSETHNSWC